MTAQEFEAQISTLRTRKPFMPFLVEYLDGRQLLIDGASHVAHLNGHAGFIAHDRKYHRFDHTTVKRFIRLVPEPEALS
jgi:hypothetical protein